MSPPAAELQDVFARALEIAAPEERSAYLEDVCGDDPVLKAEIEALLRAHGRAGDFLETPAMSELSIDDDDDDAHEPAEAVGAIVGNYKLLQEIGAGGMGIVYMAQQSAPVRRLVALKIIKPGMDSKQVVARFELEREVLAKMEHPNIAKVFDAGTTERGRPYFVMELVKGVPITSYCDALELSPRERLELFIPVCEAIQHAHRKEIIHRDIKPSNVLVERFDAKAVPRVIDFGVAKAVNQGLTDKTLFTKHGAIVGTPEYMAPEQAEDSALGVDTRTDVYSLGAVLYELLTGKTPLEQAALPRPGLFESLRRLREEEAPKLSSRLSKTKELAAIAACRKMEPAKLARLMRGELDWIVMKAIDKERKRRYESASALARDIERYLADEPVEAAPPSIGYRARKVGRKYRGPLTAVAAIALVLVAATAVSTWQAIRASREEANARQSDAESKAVLAFFRDNVLSAARPEGLEGGRGHEVKLYEAIDAAEPTIATRFAGQPRVEAAVRGTLGSSYFYLGRPGDAVRQHERAWALRQKSLGPEHPDTMSSMDDLALAYRLDGRAAQAIPLHERGLRYWERKGGREHPETLKCKNNLGVALRLDGRAKEAIPLLDEVLRAYQAIYGPDDPRSLATMQNLAVAYRSADRAAEAVTLHETCLERTRRRFGAGHPETLSAMDTLASAYLEVGKVARALPLLETAWERRAGKLGADHPETLTSASDLAVAYQLSGRTSDAVRMFQEVVEARRRKIGPDHPETLSSENSLAMTWLAAGQTGKGVTLLEEVLGMRRRKLGNENSNTLKTMNDLGGAYLDAKRWQDAEKLLRECLAAREKREADWRTYLAMSQLGAALLAQQRFDEAKPLLVRGYEGMEQHQAEIPARRKKDLSNAAARAAALFDATGQKLEAAAWKTRAERIAPAEQLDQ
jgi:serine/threonine protein kinase